MLRTSSGSLARALARASATASKSRNGRQPLQLSRRWQSSAGGDRGGGGGGATKVALVGVVSLASIAGGTLGYASVDDSFRKLVEDNVPGTKEVFASVLGGEDKKVEPTPVVPSKMRPPPPSIKVTKSLPKKETPPVDAPVRETVAMSTPPPPPIEEPPKKEVKIEKTTSPLTPAKVEHSPEIKKETKKKGKDLNFDKLVEDMKVATGMALLAARQSCEAISKHGKLVIDVLDRDVDDELNDASWHEVIQAAAEKTESLNSTKEKFEAAEVLLGKVRKELGDNAETSLAEEEIRKALSELGEAKRNSYLIEKYRDLVEEGRQKFRKEIGGILSEGKPSDEEVNVFITHAYRKICKLQQKLAKMKLLQVQMDSSAHKDQEIRKSEVVQAELENQKRQLEADYHHRISSLREDMETEVRGQLRRQAMAHQDHIKDALEVREAEITRKYGRQLDEALMGERNAYRRELGQLSADIEELKRALKERSKLQEAAKGAQELWLACCSLQRALNASRPESGVLPLSQEVDAIKNALVNAQGREGDDQFVNLVLDSLPEEAVTRGVYTDQTIRDRFFKVEKMAKRTALVDDEGGSLLLYFLSYLQSLFILTPSTSEMPDPQVPIDVSTLSTFDIVWLARGSVERGDLEQAVKYMTLLRGEPKKISSDWIEEARLLLATKQVCDVLLSHAAAFGLESFPNKV